MAAGNDLDAAEFARDTLFQAHTIAQQANQPPAGQPGAPQGAPARQYPLPF